MPTLNIQPPEKPAAVEQDGAVDVHSIFLTIQGEGPFTGTPAVFVRLAGCNLGQFSCPLCDTNYTSNRKKLLPETVLSQVCETLDTAGAGDVSLVVLTGGEPFRQHIEPLVSALLNTAFVVQIETNGTLYRELPYSHPDLTLVCSPKTPRLNPQLERQIAAYKYVVKTGAMDMDGLPACTMGATLPLARPWSPSIPVFLQPLDEGDNEKNKANGQAAVQSCLQHGYRLSLQLHKILGLE